MLKKTELKFRLLISANDENLLKRIQDEVGFPCIIKPVDTVKFTKIFRNKVFICNNIEEMEKRNQKGKR